MRISDWSSDVCSSDLVAFPEAHQLADDRERQRVCHDRHEIARARSQELIDAVVRDLFDLRRHGGHPLGHQIRKYGPPVARKSDGSGKSVSVRVYQGGGPILKKKRKRKTMKAVKYTNK